MIYEKKEIERMKEDIIVIGILYDKVIKEEEVDKDMKGKKILLIAEY